MADIHFQCPHCGSNLEVEDEGAGLQVDCPSCNEPITIPKSAREAEHKRRQRAVWILLIVLIIGGCLLVGGSLLMKGRLSDNQIGDTNGPVSPFSLGDKPPSESIRVAAEKGDAKAQYDLAVLYDKGGGVARDAVEAVKWYRKAAEQRYAYAQYNLGVCYDEGDGVTKDAAEAVKWYRKAAEQGYASAQYNLGLHYAEGAGVEKKPTEAVKWFRNAAELGLAGAQNDLAIAYSLGDGVTKDNVEAVKWFRKSAEQANVLGQFHLAVCYEEGNGVDFDPIEARNWYRKAAEQGFAEAQFKLGLHCTNDIERVSWYRKAAEQDHAMSQFMLGFCYYSGDGVTKNRVEALKWYRKAAELGLPAAQNDLAVAYSSGDGVTKDNVEAGKWWRKAAEQGVAASQTALGSRYANGHGVPKDYVEAHKWLNLASAQGDGEANKDLAILERRMTPSQIAEAQRLAREFKPREAPDSGVSASHENIYGSNPAVSGTGFFISEDGFLVTNEHVVKDATQVRLVTSAGLISAKVVKVDAANDLALLKAEGRFAALPVATSRAVKLGGMVATVGFPNIGLQGFAPKLAKGEIASLSGAGDDARYFQISVPVQPGNSGGALVDERGNVVGVVSAKLSARAALATSGALPENVNYAVKSSFLLGFLESVPEVSARLKEPNTKERKFEDVVKSAEQAAVLVLVY